QRNKLNRKVVAKTFIAYCRLTTQAQRRRPVGPAIGTGVLCRRALQRMVELGQMGKHTRITRSALCRLSGENVVERRSRQNYRASDQACRPRPQLQTAE